MGNDDFLNVGFIDDEEQNAFLDDTADMTFGDDTKEEEAKEEVKEKEEIAEDADTGVETEEAPESVGDEEDNEDEDTAESEGSPVSASIAQAFQEIGVLQTLDKDAIANIKSTEDLADAMEQEVRNRMDVYSRRVMEALQYRVPISEVQKMEGTLRWFDSITDEVIENEENENLRGQLIYRDLLEKGHSEEEAKELTDDFIASGKDVEKAKKALESCKNIYANQYNAMIQQAKEAQETREKQVRQLKQRLEKSIMEDDKIFKELDINKSTRQKILDTAMKPTETMEDGQKVTPLSKYQNEHPEDFYKYMSMFFVLTDGFTKLGNVMKEQVRKETRKGIDKLERVINSTSRNADGSLKLKSGVSQEFNPFDLDNIRLMD